jgi:hypothetical protein
MVAQVLSHVVLKPTLDWPLHNATSVTYIHRLDPVGQVLHLITMIPDRGSNNVQVPLQGVELGFGLLVTSQCVMSIEQYCACLPVVRVRCDGSARQFGRGWPPNLHLDLGSAPLAVVLAPPLAVLGGLGQKDAGSGRPIHHGCYTVTAVCVGGCLCLCLCGGGAAGEGGTVPKGLVVVKSTRGELAEDLSSSSNSESSHSENAPFPCLRGRRVRPSDSSPSVRTFAFFDAGSVLELVRLFLGVVIASSRAKFDWRRWVCTQRE